jgi:hypothetical protein
LEAKNYLHYSLENLIFNNMSEFNTARNAENILGGGALEPYSKEAERHSEIYYESVRKMTTDIENIAKNTGFDKQDIWRIKEHIFYKEHDLGEAEKRRFHPSYDMAQSWQRLIDGRAIEPHDIILLRHELMEVDLMDNGLSQQDAHNLTNLKFNYRKALDDRRQA